MAITLSKEEKLKRKEERNRIKYEKEHKILNDIVYKLCNLHNTYYSNEDNFIVMDDKHFYKNIKNSIDGYSSRCIECEKKRAAEWTKEHPLSAKKSYKRYMQTPNYKEYKKRNNEETKIKMPEYRNKNPKQFRQYSKNRGQKNHIITEKEWYDCKLFFNFRCAYCGMTYEEHYDKYSEDLHKEHVIWDGKDNLSNCIPACKSCNSIKHKESLNNWYNLKNVNYTYERYYKIYEWLHHEYKKHIKKRKSKQKYTKRNMEFWNNR